MPRKAKTVNLFEYRDYRDYLRDYYAQAKKSPAGFSLRLFSERAGFGSSNFFKLVMDGDRNLTEKSIQAFMKGLELSKAEQVYFYNLVFFNQAESHEAKNHYYQKVLQERRVRDLKPMEKDHHEFYSAWYHAVVRELAVSRFYDGTALSLAKRIQPKISIEKIEESLKLLVRLGFLIPQGKKFALNETLMTSGLECESVTLMNYHKEILRLANHQLEAISSDRRDVSALTLGFRKELLPVLKAKIQEFRREILSLVSAETHPEEVVVLSMQLFPVASDGE